MIESIKAELQHNNNKISKEFVDNLLYNATTTHMLVTPNTRVCVITLHSGHDLVGYAQVLDSSNDIESIGQKIAYENASEQIWSLVGSIAKALI